jgi:hypothetical protein
MQPLSTKFTSLHKTTLFFKANQYKQTAPLTEKTSNYIHNPQFNNFKIKFLTSSFPLVHPFIRKKNRTFSFFPKSFTKKLLKTQRLKKKIFSQRKF